MLSVTSLSAQETYTVKGETLQLKTEVEGSLDLLWNIIDGNYRYFIRTTDNSITELGNTRNENHHYQEEYKTVLGNLTGVSADKVNLTLPDLKAFIENYNESQDPNFKVSEPKANLQLMLDVFGGITNSPLVDNPNNENAPQFGGELELSDGNRTSRHALFIQLRHVFKPGDFKYTTTELALGYRFRVINLENFDVFAQTKFATLNFVENTVPGANDIPVDISETAFDVPFTFGIGADIRVTRQSFLTIHYNELFAVLLENNGHFSTNLTLGYKFNL